jgi:hypothetical protein
VANQQNEATRSQSRKLANGRELKIVAHAVFPPIPDNRGDWQAFDDATYDGGGPLGVGATLEAAIEDLIAQICECEDTELLS